MTEFPAAIQRFLDGIRTGDWDGVEAHFAPDAVYDGSMPGWRVRYQGPERIARDLREEWTGRHTWRVVEIHVSPTPDGTVIDFELRGPCPGDEAHPGHEEAVRVANIFRLEKERIAEHRWYCCGEWDEETVRRIEAEAPKVAARPPAVSARTGG